MPNASAPRIDHLLRQVDGLPTLPAVAVRVLEATGRDESTIADVIDVLRSDPPLAARMLQLVRRADLGIRGEVDTVDRAVALLGFDAVRAAVLAVGVFEALSPDAAGAGGGQFDRNEFWKHAVAVACCGEQLAALLPFRPGQPSVQPSAAFLAGLLHDIGKVALDALLPKSFNRVVEATDLLRGNIADVERTVIGLDHLTAGKRLAERWQLPAAFVEVAWLHGQDPAALPEDLTSPRLVNLISLADLLVRELHLGYSGNHVLTGKPALLDALGLPPQAVQGVVDTLVARVEPRAAALGLADATSDALYRSALTRANRELGRLGDQLASRNRKLQGRSRFFDALTRFQSELRPDADVTAVLRAVARTAAEALGVRSVVAFANSPAAADLCAVIDGQSTDLPPTEPLTLPPPGSLPMRPAGRDFAAATAGLPGPIHYWVGLPAGDRTVGGVAWSGGSDEPDRLGGQMSEIAAMATAWSLAVRTAQAINAHRQLAEQLAESNRKLHDARGEAARARSMAAVGELAAGAAHEINTPLAVLSGRAQLLATQLSDPAHRRAAETIVAQADRASRVVTDLMAFSDPAMPAVRPTDLGPLLTRAVGDAKARGGSADRHVDVTLADALPPALIDDRQVMAAVSELVANALAATAAGGRVAVSAAATDVLVVTVADDGPGMDEATADRAFDPFYSRQPAGRRRGLGLAKAARWLAASGGTVRLDTCPGRGTRAVVTLPVAPDLIAN